MTITPNTLTIPMNHTLTRGGNLKIYIPGSTAIVLVISYNPKTHRITIRNNTSNIFIHTIKDFHSYIRTLYPTCSYHLQIIYKYSQCITDGYILNIESSGLSCPIISQNTQDTYTHLRPASLIIPPDINITTSFADIFTIMQPQFAQHYAWIASEINDHESISVYSSKIWGTFPIIKDNIQIYIEASIDNNDKPVHIKAILYTEDESFIFTLADQQYALHTNMCDHIHDILHQSVQNIPQYIQQGNAYFSQHTLIAHARILAQLPHSYNQNVHTFIEKLHRLFQQHYIHP